MVQTKFYVELTKSYICKVSIIFGKESFTNAKKVLNFIQSLIKWKESNKAPKYWDLNLTMNQDWLQFRL